MVELRELGGEDAGSVTQLASPVAGERSVIQTSAIAGAGPGRNPGSAVAFARTAWPLQS